MVQVQIKWCVIYSEYDIRDFRSESEALKAYPDITDYCRTEYEQSIVYRHPQWQSINKKNNNPNYYDNVHIW